MASTISGCGKMTCPGHGSRQTIGFELVIGGIGRFRHAVAVNDQSVADRERVVVFLILDERQNADDRAAAFELLVIAARANDERGIVTRIAEGQFAGFAVEDAEKNGDEPIGRAVGACEPIQARHDVGEIFRLLGEGLNTGLQTHHQQRGGHAFTGNVAKHHGDSAALVGEEIVIVAADGTAGRVVAGEIEPCYGGSNDGR